MSNECDKSPTYLSYMLRLWQAGSRGGQQVWRASLENPHTGERQAFGGVEALVAFLAEKTSLPARFGNTLDTPECTVPQEERSVL
jgi:hypothetical protein